MTWGIFTSLIESALCTDTAECSSRRMDEWMEEIDLDDVADFGYGLTGIYLSPKSIINPFMWASLARSALPPDIRNLETFAETKQLLREFENTEDKTDQTTLLAFAKTFACSTSEIVFNIGDMIFINQGKDFLVNLSLAEEWNTLNYGKLKKKFANTAQDRGWRMAKATIKSACQGLTIADAYLKSYHPTKETS